MTGLGPSLRKLPSADARSNVSTTAGQPEGTSDAGDSSEGNTGMLFMIPAMRCHARLLLLEGTRNGCFWVHVQE